eukprot:TRINITY_DN1814_c0_g2_i1.p1 TRINITY_DN1814_c0_g2~~TRINITY_DN1814_c0_g2_i1.p1  ORF type:complete len:246 (-),score=22.42 TRINITY_DN1814_c0_g2_i1:65-802(-)
MIKINRQELRNLRIRNTEQSTYMQDIISTLTVHKDKTKASAFQLKTDIIPMIVAGQLVVSEDLFKFSINRIEVLIDPVRNKRIKLFEEKGAKLEPITEIKGESIKHTEAMKASCLFTGRTIDEFVEIYGKMPNINKLIARREDPERLIELYRDFLILTDRTIDKSQELPLCVDENRKNIVSHIERYIMTKLYAPLFSVRYSEEDIKLNKELKKLQELPYKFFKIKEEHCSKHLCALVIAGTASLY